MSYEYVLWLPNSEARARLCGKRAKKREDIEKVSGARLSIENLRVVIRAPSEESLDLAIKMIKKSEDHRLAALKVIPTMPRPENVLKSDLLLAAYYTFPS